MFGSSSFVLLSIFGSGLPFLLLILVAVFWRRSEEADPSGRRPFATYLFSVIFVSLLAVVTCLGIIGATVAHAITNTSFGGGGVTCSTSAELNPSAFAVPRTFPTLAPLVQQGRKPFAPPGSFNPRFKPQFSPPPQFVPRAPQSIPNSRAPAPDCTRGGGGMPRPLVIYASILAALGTIVGGLHASKARALLQEETKT